MRRAALVAALPLSLAACHKSKQQAPDPAATKPAVAAGNDTQPVYPKLSGPPDARAVRLCAAVHGGALARRSECCHAPPSQAMSRVVAECERTLTAALAASAIAIDEAELGACEAEMKARLVGCAWIGPLPVAASPRCSAALRGRVQAGAACRSSLECEGQLRCDGVGPTDPGRCARAGTPGVACRMSVDPLASFVRDERVDVSHPECEGWCERHRCVPHVAEGQACTSPSQCGPGHRCAGRKCVAGAEGSAGEACTGGGCASPGRCFHEQCLTPRPDGPCTSDFECLGACIKQPGQAQGSCAMDCTRT
jgi:hypothetical protein